MGAIALGICGFMLYTGLLSGVFNRTRAKPRPKALLALDPDSVDIFLKYNGFSRTVRVIL
jgi:hypothetical protein